VATAGFAADLQIRLNTIGFLPDQPKRASVAADCAKFLIVRISDGAKVLEGTTAGPLLNTDTDEKLWTADFSKISEPGVYRLEVPGVGHSPSFRVGKDIYVEPYRTAMLGMYLWRCGTAVSAKYNGQVYAHDACHLDDGYLDFVDGGHVKKMGTKGWHDAGDYNKYVVNAGFSVGVMLAAWEQFAPNIKDIRLKIPESGKVTPDFLSEVRWELEWLLTMQMDDGRVYHKLSTQKFGGFILPEKETTPRFFTPWSSAAAADMAAVMAMAGRIYEPYDKPFARRCLDAAKRSYEYLAAHPQNHPADPHGFSTGAYQANDSSRRLWAAAEIWRTTGNARFLNDFEDRARASSRKIDRSCGWGNVRNLGMYTYLLSTRPERDAALIESVRRDLINTADQILKARDAHGYARPLGTDYYWGCNGDVAQQAQTLQIAAALTHDRKYTDAALDDLGYLFGRNYYGRSFVTGLGSNPPMHPHDRRSGAAHIGAWPGYLVGGGWPRATDWQDRQDNYRVNEIAINWNATLIYALAGFVETGSPKPIRN
jgi:endoglucanase